MLSLKMENFISVLKKINGTDHPGRGVLISDSILKNL